MASVVLLLVLCALPSLTHAGCVFSRKDPEMGGACRDSKNHLHEVGSKWRQHCMDCICSATGLQCCDVLPTSIVVPADCKEVYDKTNCRRFAVKKNDPSIECPAIAGVGK